MRIEKEELLFGRYSREECGLPPSSADVFGDRLAFGKTLALFALLAAAAWLSGLLQAGSREAWLRALPARVAEAGGNGEARSALMRRGALLAAALPGSARARRDLAFAAVTAAEYAPRRLGYIGNALALLEGAQGGGGDGDSDEAPLETVAREMTLSGLHEETGGYEAALAALDRAEQALSALPDEQARRSFRLLLVNARAYCLALAGKDGGGDARRALELANLAVSSRDELPGGGFASASAAFVDTLATARFHSGLGREAADAQRLALGLAPSRGLEVYLEHFDTFSGTASKGEAHVQ